MPNSYITKQLLAESLKKQMEKTALNKISIQNIVDGCGLTRQAFYYHFQDIYELLGWIYNNETIKYMARNKTYENWKDGYLEAFRYIEKNRVFCMNTLHSVGRDHLERFLFANTADYLNQIVNEISEDMKVTEDKKKFIVKFYTPAFIALVAEWMEDGMKEKPEEIIENVSILLDGSVKRALEQYEKKDQ